MNKLIFIVMIFIPTVVKANQEQEATRAAAEALYKQSGVDIMINDFIDKNIPDKVKTIVGNSFVVFRAFETKIVTYNWTF